MILSGPTSVISAFLRAAGVAAASADKALLSRRAFPLAVPRVWLPDVAYLLVGAEGSAHDRHKTGP